MIDISMIKYSVELITETGARYPLDGALISLQWEEQKNELAQRATITVANTLIGNAWLMSLAKINCQIIILAEWSGNGRQQLFTGIIWEWQYLSSTQKELTITAYDPLIRLQRSKDFKYYSAGMDTKSIVSDICTNKEDGWGIPFRYAWGKSITHEKKIFHAERVSDMLVELLDEVRRKTGEKYVIYYKDGQMQIVGIGANSIVYKFDSSNTESTFDKLTINNLVTRVKVIGKQDNDGRASVVAIVKGDTRYGVLQEIVRQDGDKTLDAAKSEAQTILKERGKPEETIQINVPDLPFLRKGDIIEVSAANLNNRFHIVGVTHNATSRKMTLTIERIVA